MTHRPLLLTAALALSSFTCAAEHSVPCGNLGKLESLTRHRQLISCEATVEKGGRHREVAFTPDGSPMKAD